MKSNQNQTTARREPDLSITIMITELDDTKSCYQLIKTMTEFEKETRYQLYVFIKNNS